MEFAEAMKLLKTENSELAEAVQEKITSTTEEAKRYRQKNSVNNDVLSTIIKELGVSNVEELPERVTNTTTEFNAIVAQRNEDRQLIDTLIKESEENKRLLGRTTIKEELTAKFKSAGYKDPSYHAELYTDRAKRGETGLLIGDGFADDVIKNLGVSQPYLLSKEIEPEVTGTPDQPTPPANIKDFTIEEIENMSEEEIEKNAEAIIAQANKEG